MLIVLIYECFEATLQRREIFKAKRKEREERRKKRMRYMARKIREKRAIEQQLIDEEEAAKKSAYMDQVLQTSILIGVHTWGAALHLN